MLGKLGGAGRYWLRVLVVLGALLPSLSGQKVAEPALRPDRQASFLSGLRLAGNNLPYGEYVTDAMVDRQGFIYVVATTYSGLLPTSPLAYQRAFGGCIRNGCAETDGYIFKLDPTGKTLLAATYFGGLGREDFHRVLVDSKGNVIVAGSGLLLPLTPDAPFAGGNNFILKFDSDLSQVLYATRWPGPPSDIAVDEQDRIYVAGWAAFGAVTFAPARFGYEHACGAGRDCSYVARLDARGRRVEVVASFPARVESLRLAPGGGVWIAGYAGAEWSDLQPARRDRLFPRPNPSFRELFIARLTTDLQELSARAVLPERRTWESSELDPKIQAMTLDPAGNLYLTGGGRQRLPITSNAAQRDNLGGTAYAQGNGDGFLTVVRATSEVQYSTWIGTEQVETGLRVTVDNGGTAWVLGAMRRWSLDVNPPCASWVVGIDPRKKGDDSLRYSGCSNNEFGGTLENVGRVALAPDGNLIITALSRATSRELTEEPGIRVYRLDTLPQARMTFSPTAPSVVRTNDIWEFSTKLENIGSADAVNTKFEFEGRLPLKNYTFVRTETTQGWCSGEAIHCELGVLPAGSSAVVRVLVKDNSSHNEFTLSQFQAQASWEEAGGSRYNWAKEHPPAAFAELGDLELTVEGYKPVVSAGETIRYMLTLKNHGPDDASEVGLKTNIFIGRCEGQCFFQKIKAGEQVQTVITVKYAWVGRMNIQIIAHRRAEHPTTGYSGDPNRLNNIFLMPIDVVGESRPATVLTSYILYVNRPYIQLVGQNIYATSTGYWDGAARQVTFSRERAYLQLQEGDLRQGHHKAKVCSPVAGCSNELAVVIEKDEVAPPLAPRMSLRLESGVAAAPYLGTRVLRRLTVEVEEQRKIEPGLKDP